MSHRDGWRKPLSHVWQHLSIASGYLEVNTGRGEHLGQLTKANFPDAAPSVLKTPGNATVPCECVCVWQPSNRNVNSMHLWQPAQLKQPKPRKRGTRLDPMGKPNRTRLKDEKLAPSSTWEKHWTSIAPTAWSWPRNSSSAPTRWQLQYENYGRLAWFENRTVGPRTEAALWKPVFWQQPPEE